MPASIFKEGGWWADYNPGSMRDRARGVVTMCIGQSQKACRVRGSLEMPNMDWPSTTGCHCLAQQ